MFFAIIENEKKEPMPNTEGICSLCKRSVFSRCGDVNVWHWSHFKDENCDHWYEPETFWHKHWKMTFGKENAEKVVEINGKRHFADILTENSIVIELQNSSIQKSIIKEREDFYGERMLWLINGEKFKKNLIVKDYWVDQDYIEIMSLPRPPINWKRSSPEVKKGINGEFFKWKHPRKSWEDVQRPVFIDFGEDSLFLVKEGMGTSQIRGTYFSKEKFINKYGGYHDYYRKQDLARGGIPIQSKGKELP